MPTKDRQRAIARAKLERQMAKRAEHARKMRRIKAGVGAGIVLLVLIAGAIWLIAKYGPDDKEDSTKATPASCKYLDVGDRDPATIKDVGKPSTKNIARTGTRNSVITTNFGSITVQLDQAGAPCTVNSWAYLTSKHFYDNTTCHRMTNELLQCGSSNPEGTGSPKYRFDSENLPTGVHPAYPKGTVAMANSGTPNSVTSQFFIMFADTELEPNYTVVGEVTAGLDVLEKIAAVGHDGAFDPNPGGGHPKQTVTIDKLTVS